MKTTQLKFLENQPKAYGGVLLKTRKGRSHGRPLDTKHTIHLVLRASKAVGPWSFKRPNNEKKIRRILSKFAAKHGIKILSLANVGNHLHLQIKLATRFTYKPFIKAVTGSIAMAITGKTRWCDEKSEGKLRFWDYRPFTRVVMGYKALLNLRHYIEINEIEGFGHSRNEARFIWRKNQMRWEAG